MVVALDGWVGALAGIGGTGAPPPAAFSSGSSMVKSWSRLVWRWMETGIWLRRLGDAGLVGFGDRRTGWGKVSVEEGGTGSW